jgi:hypothetical protein
MAPDDCEFWVRLARRITDVLRSSQDNNVRFLWVDDVIPETQLLAAGQKFMFATALVSENDGKSFVQYKVKLSFSEVAAETYRAGNGCGLLPNPDTADWLKISKIDNEIEVDFV